MMDRPWRELVELWSAYNRCLAHIVRNVAPEALENIWDAPAGPRILRFTMEDYLRHMRHHLAQI